MRFQYFTVAIAGLAAAAPVSDLTERQIATPSPGSPESFKQASDIMSGLAQGLKGMTGVPFAGDAASILGSLASGLGQAGKSGASHSKRQTLPGALPGQPAPGTPESFAQASNIIGQLAKGLQGFTNVPFATSSASTLQGIAEGLGKAGKAAGAAPGTVAATGSATQQAQAAAIMQGMANGLKGGKDIPFSGDAASWLSGIAGGLSGGAKAGAA